MTARLQKLAELLKELTYDEMIEFANDHLLDSVNGAMLNDGNYHGVDQPFDRDYFPSILSDWADDNMESDQ